MMTIETTIASSISVWRSVLIDSPISHERSYVGTIFTPAGIECWTSWSLALTPSITFRAFSPKRMTMMPPTASPFPSSSATPRRMSGPRRTCATSRTRIGVPREFAPSETFSMSATDFR